MLLVWNGAEFKEPVLPRDKQLLHEAAEHFLISSGVRDICKQCWAGELPWQRKETACCMREPSFYGQGFAEPCRMLTDTGCAAKPTRCQLYVCGGILQRMTEFKWPKAVQETIKLMQSSWLGGKNYFPTFAWSFGFLKEAKQALGTNERIRVNYLTGRLNLASRALEKRRANVSRDK